MEGMTIKFELDESVIELLKQTYQVVARLEKRIDQLEQATGLPLTLKFSTAATKIDRSTQFIETLVEKGELDLVSSGPGKAKMVVTQSLLDYIERNKVKLAKAS